MRSQHPNIYNQERIPDPGGRKAGSFLHTHPCPPPTSHSVQLRAIPLRENIYQEFFEQKQECDGMFYISSILALSDGVFYIPSIPALSLLPAPALTGLVATANSAVPVAHWNVIS